MSNKNQPPNEPSQFDTPLARVKRFLEILQYKQNDLTKYKKEMDSLKSDIKQMLETYKSQTDIPTIYSQKLLVNIHDKYTEFKDVEDKYFKSRIRVEYLQKLIESINIRPCINDAIDAFNFEL